MHIVMVYPQYNLGAIIYYQKCVAA